MLVPQFCSGLVCLGLIPDDSKHPCVGASPSVSPVGNINQSFVESVSLNGCDLVIGHDGKSGSDEGVSPKLENKRSRLKKLIQTLKETKTVIIQVLCNIESFPNPLLIQAFLPSKENEPKAKVICYLLKPPAPTSGHIH